MKLTKQGTIERDAAIARLREWLAPGDTVYTILDHVSASGMSRIIRCVLLKLPDTLDNRVIDLHISSAVGRACGYRHGRRHGREVDGLRTDGCGMDMGFGMVYTLSRVLFGAGFGCIGKGCPSNDHSNGDRDYTPHTCRATDSASGNEYAAHHTHRAAEGQLPRLGKYGCCHWHTDGGYALRHRWL